MRFQRNVAYREKVLERLGTTETEHHFRHQFSCGKHSR
jgi:hypothetical protein